MKILISFILGVVVGVVAHWVFAQPRSQVTLADAREEARQATTNVGQALKETFDPTAIKDELAKTGRVIREKARQAGDTIADATANARTTAAIKAKLVQDTGLSAFKIDVDTTSGVVTLSGSVASHEEIARAMKLALETEGVNKVISTLQVQAK
jgi:osmotically-inducible protein OsmY